MDTSTGYILNESQVTSIRRALSKDEFGRRIKPMNTEPTTTQLQRNPPRIGRNEVCPCGSGLKFKKCCLGKRR